jgi:hypothetical protein
MTLFTKPQQLEKKLIPEVLVADMVNVYGGPLPASFTDPIAPFQYALAKGLPFLTLDVGFIFRPPFPITIG